MVALEAKCTPPPADGRTYFAPILVVDDDFAIRRAIAESLIDEGYDVRCAADGREALAILGDRAARPGLIILDLWMPSMDGLEFRILQTSIADWADIPVLIVTAAQSLPWELEHLKLPHVLHKPLRLNDLLTKTRELIGH